MTMESNWQLKDIIDLEYYLHQDSRPQLTELPSGDISLDRKIFLEYEKSHQAPFSRKDLLRFWLDHQKKEKADKAAGPIRSPGEIFLNSFRIIRLALILFAVATGASLAWAILSYTGSQPVNVFTFLWIIIVPQFILLLILLFSLILRRLGFLKDYQGISLLAASAIRWTADKLIAAGSASLSAASRSRIHAIFGLIGRQKTVYGSVFLWPVFTLFQVFGVCFNIGILGASLLKITITDLAFGWQSTLQLPADTVFRLVKWLAAPWSWFVSMRYSYPSISEIEGSKMILKEGMTHLTTSNLVSWWPFLCFAVLFYGFAPRFFLFIIGTWRQYRALKQIDFTHAACERLIQRMQTPQMATLSRPFSSRPSVAKTSSKIEQTDPQLLSRSAESLPSTIVFVPEDLDKILSYEDIKDRISSVFRLRMLGRIRFVMDFQKDRKALKEFLDQTDVSLQSARLVIPQEAWQPPIRETISWIQNLRNAAGKKTGIIVALIGKPNLDKAFAAPQDTDLVIWEHAVESLGDPYIRTENFGG